MIRNLICAGRLAVACICAVSAVSAQENALSENQRNVLICVENMGDSTTWPQCTTLMFGPCSEAEVGSGDHVECLTTQHSEWTAVMTAQREALTVDLTSTGATELGQLMGQWFVYVAQKCADVAANKTDLYADAANLGCEISEIAGVTAEFVACRNGRSTAPYCVTQE